MINLIINKITTDILETFGEVSEWLKLDKSLQLYQPANNGWSIMQILEHITLTNHYLLILIRKGTRKCIEISKTKDYGYLPDDYNIDWAKMNQVGDRMAFEWKRPEHMVPTGNFSLDQIADRLNTQLNDCLSLLSQLKNGEGVLYKTMMSVNGIGKIDVYHYIVFLVQHACRHIAQMNSIRTEFSGKE